MVACFGIVNKTASYICIYISILLKVYYCLVSQGKGDMNSSLRHSPILLFYDVFAIRSNWLNYG